MAKRVAADSLDAQLDMVRRHLPVALVVNVVNTGELHLKQFDKSI